MKIGQLRCRRWWEWRKAAIKKYTQLGKMKVYEETFIQCISYLMKYDFVGVVFCVAIGVGGSVGKLY